MLDKQVTLIVIDGDPDLELDAVIGVKKKKKKEILKKLKKVAFQNKIYIYSTFSSINMKTILLLLLL